MAEIQTLSFSVNQWEHLYSLQQAISHAQNLNGNVLVINGLISNHVFLQHSNTPVCIKFLLTHTLPAYSVLDSGLHELGTICLLNQQLETEIKVDQGVFEEMRKNLMEYGELDGIHIVVTLGLLSSAENWLENQTLQVVQLDYAMKGDA